MSEENELLKLPPESELHHPIAPWRQGSYEHVHGTQYPDIAETPVAARLKAAFPDDVLAFKGYRGDATVLVKKDKITDILKFLRDDPECSMDMMRDLFGVDNQRTPARVQEFKDAGLKEEIRFEVIYLLYSLRFRHELRVRVGITEKEAQLPSALRLYKAADWFEREAWDMYGIVFEGHPNLKRLLNHEYFEGHPLRKDYPVRRRHNIRTPIDL